jgi:hypothetical protein
VLALTALACGSGEEGSAEGSDAAAAMADGAAGGSERARVLGEFLAEHWRLPIPAQGEPPEGFSEAEASLDPEACGACHPRQHQEWQTSLHAAAYSPGFAGQLIEGALSEASQVRHCQTCHAPLSEQQPWDAAGAAREHDQALRAQGIVCAACHVRAHRRLGPPRRADLSGAAQPLPHGGFEARPEFGEARFCAECHHFFDDEGVDGKPIQNTFAEWQASPAAAAGRSCQSCHMPDRSHTWRGIHDPEMVRSGVEVRLEVEPDPLRATLVLANRDVGHAFPTYVTPRVFLAISQLDGEGVELEETRVDHAIGREIDFGDWSEVFDRRVLPGKEATLAYDRPRHPDARVLRGRVTVDPAYHYRGVFESLLASYETPEARRELSLALERANETPYVLFESLRPLPAL